MWKHSKSATENIISIMVQKGQNLMKTNLNVKNNFSQYTNQSVYSISQNMVVQSSKPASQQNVLFEQSKPQPIKKDNSVVRSVPILKRNKIIPIQKSVSLKKAQKMKTDKKEKKQNLRDQLRKFINPSIKLELTGKSLNYQGQHRIPENPSEKCQSQSQKSSDITTRQSKKPICGNYTFDLQGKPLYVEPSKTKKSLSKPFPVTLEYSSQSQPRTKQIPIFFNSPQNPKKSLVNQNQEERSNIFHNYKERQTSIIPHIKLEEGVCLTQAGTSSQIKRQNSESRSRMTNSFFKYISRRSSQQILTKNEKGKVSISLYEGSRWIKEQKKVENRAKSAYIPSFNRANRKKSSGIVKSVNQNLRCSLLQ